MTFTFAYTYGTKFETVDTIFATLDVYNLKNKAAGARRYGYTGQIQRATNPAGEVAYRAVYQTTLDGARYQSGKYSNWVATACEAHDLLAKTIKGAMTRYAKLARDPASKIEYRTPLAADTTCKLAEAADRVPSSTYVPSAFSYDRD